MLSIIAAFLSIGAIILIGFISNILFRESRIPDVLILIALGALIGPGFLAIIDNEMFLLIEGMAPFLAALALAMIMFDGGMGLNHDSLTGSLTKNMLHTMVAFLLSIMVTTAVCYVFFGWDLMTSLLLGSILGGTSGAIVIPLTNRLRVSPQTRNLLTLESALTDVIVIVMAVSIMFLITGMHGDVGGVLGSLGLAFLVAFMIGIVAGLIWLRLLADLGDHPFAYMITVAALLVIYSLTELTVGRTGIGAISALVFGLVISNKNEFGRLFRGLRNDLKFDEEIRSFHREIFFFVRSFFFVYLGLVFSMTPIRTGYVIAAIGIFLGILGMRAIASRVTGSALGMDQTNRMAIFFMMPRGLSAAVLAGFPLTQGVVSTEIGSAFLTVTVVVIILTTIMACVGAFTVENISPTEEQAKKTRIASQSRLAARWMTSQEREGERPEEGGDSELFDLDD